MTKAMASAACLLALPAALFVSSCSRVESAPPSEPAAAPSVPQPADDADPASFSWAAAFGAQPYRLLERLEPPLPFPRSFRASDSGLELRYGEGRAWTYGEIPAASPPSGAEFPSDSGGRARRGAYRYEVGENGDLVASLETGEKGSDGAPPERTLWRFVPEFRISAGPLAFDDVVVVATAAPSLVAVDRRTGTVAMEITIGERLAGPLFYLPASARLVARGADGALYAYGASSPSAESADPVEALLRPAPAAVSAIGTRLAERLGTPGERPLLSFFPYGPRDELPESGAAVFRYDSKLEQRSRVYVDGAGARPALVEIFSEDGETRASNLDYIGLDAVIDYTFAEGKSYYIAAAFLSREESAAADGAASPRARLVVAKK